MSKYYAVKNGRKTGVFDSWAECEKQVKGFSHAVYKSFSRKQEALNFIEGVNKMVHNNSNDLFGLNSLNVYVDGSYNSSEIIGGYGCVMLKNNAVVHTISKAYDANKHDNMANVTSEIFATLAAVEWALNNKYKRVTIYYDYNGIADWVTGAWRTNRHTTRLYAQEMKKYQESIKIRFVKVKAHSGDEYNDKADELAKPAIDNWLLVNK